MRTVRNARSSVAALSFAAIVAATTGSLAQQSTGTAPTVDVAALTKACDGGNAVSCRNLGVVYQSGRGAARDVVHAATLYQRACDRNDLEACSRLANLYETGLGVPKDLVHAAALHQSTCDRRSWNCTGIARMYDLGLGVPKDPAHALELFRRACDDGNTFGCGKVGAAPPQARTAQPAPAPAASARPSLVTSSGTGFVVTETGLLLTAYHVVDGAAAILVKCPGGASLQATISAKSPTVDLAVLQAKSTTPFKEHLLLAANGGAIGDRVFTVGYPAPSLLGVEPKYTEGTVSSMAGPKGDASFLQVSVPIQPGNSGGPLMDESGTVLGIVVSAAAPAAFLKDTGTLPQNINWAVKAAYAIPLLPPMKTISPRKVSAKDRPAVIARATAASCIVVATRPAPPPVTTASAPAASAGGRGAAPPLPNDARGNGGRGVVGGLAGGIVNGLDGAPPPPPPPPPAPVRIGGAVKQPQKIKDAKPVYPAIAQSARVQGVVIVETTVGPDGRVKEAKVLRSIPLLDQAALDAVKQWEFTPTLLNGVAVPVIMTVTVNFTFETDVAGEERACVGGDMAKCTALAAQLRSGSGTERDPAKASAFYQRACDSAVPAACHSLARMYEVGDGIPVDLAAAMRLHAQACEAGDAAGCTAAARLTYTGRGTAKSPSKATALYDQAIAASQSACERRNVNACRDLAYLALVFQTGREAPQNVPRALAWYRTACDHGATVGCAFLGTALAQGTGIPKDLAQAAQLYQRGCTVNAPVPPDDPDRASMIVAGRVQACGNLGDFYEHGTGVAENRPQAVVMYQRACDAQQVKGVELPRMQNRCDDVTRLQAR